MCSCPHTIAKRLQRQSRVLVLGRRLCDGWTCAPPGNAATLKRWVADWGISTAHFDHDAERSYSRSAVYPLEQILRERSTYSRGKLKQRLYDARLKERRCELCGQGEIWQGRPMSLILDHINGVRDDHRLDNLRIVCANCNATLDTHCGRKLRFDPRTCVRCGKTFQPKYGRHRYCSRACGQHGTGRAGPRHDLRRVERPPYDELVALIAATSYCAVGRRYGVSDNAVRKWVRAYKRDLTVHA